MGNNNRKKIEIKMADAFDLQADLTDILRHKSSMKLKLELTDILLQVKNKTQPANELMQELFRDQGVTDQTSGQMMLPRFVDGGKEETEAYKEYKTLQEQPVELECPLVSMNLLESMETETNYPALIKLILENQLQRE
jgi:hypothetical protein